MASMLGYSIYAATVAICPASTSGYCSLTGIANPSVPIVRSTMVERQATFVNALWHPEGQRASVYQGFVVVGPIGNGV